MEEIDMTTNAKCKDAAPIKWPTDASHYQLIGVIGSGAYAVVYKAHCKDNNRDVAVKVLKLENPSINLDDIRKEVLTMRLCSSDNVLSCHCCFNVNASLWIVTPFMSKGSLLRVLQYLRKTGRIKEGQGLDEPIVAYIIQQTAFGLQYLHDSNLLHRDVKAGNILVDGEGNVRLADFGVARVVDGSHKRVHAHTFVGTPCWMAPEIMNRQTYDASADMWSLGITALELFKGYPPLARFDAMEVIVRTLQGDAPSFASYSDAYPTKPSSAFVSWVGAVLKKDPRQRLSASRALAHRWLSNCLEGKQKLVELLREIPDLAGEQSTFMEGVKEKPAYVENTNWDFSLGGAEKEPWLKRFEAVSSKE
ncbi:protein kinase [Blastocystis sp. ATCC 50177/Nand II]|uniref:Protein kinase n=1 Tax=Blastocystis sp. subtype 1 (strain ATCC 50177 / NandII) TaxID=478820 RepID=A0A196SM74_BLAHN|nr:protein kinase [Blastocystis sp. ATCC 50177/Nand II]